MFQLKLNFITFMTLLLLKVCECTPVAETISTTTLKSDLSSDDFYSLVVRTRSDNFKDLENKAVIALKSIKDFEGDAVDKIEKTGEVLVKLTSTAIKDISKYIQQVILIASNNLNEISVDTKEFLDKAYGHIEKAIDEIGEKMLELTNVTIKEVLVDLKEQLKDTQKQFNELAQIADQQLQQVVTHINQTLIDKTTATDSWANELRAQLNEMQNSTAHNEACKIVDGFVTGTVNELYDCCNIAIKPVKTVCSRISNILNETLQVVVDVIEKMDKCIFDEQTDLGTMIPCLNDAYDNVAYLLSKAASIRHTLIVTVPIKIVVSNFCVSFTAVSIDSRKVIIQDEIHNKYLH